MTAPAESTTRHPSDAEAAPDSRVRLTPLPSPAFVDQLAHHSTAVGQSHTRKLRSPFCGLAPFNCEDHELFRGRDSEVRAVLDMLQSTGFVAIVGARYTGRTSLIEAGVLGGLRKRDGAGVWYAAHLTGTDLDLNTALRRSLVSTLRSSVATSTREREQLLDACLDGSTDAIERAAEHVLPSGDARLLLVVEQFDTIARSRSEEAQQLVRQLIGATRRRGTLQRVNVVLVTGDEGVADFGEFPGLASALTGSTLALQAPTRAQLRQSMEEPLRTSGWKITPALKEQLLADCAEREHSMSWLQHALQRIAMHATERGILDLTTYAAAECPRQLQAHAAELSNGKPEHLLPPLSQRQLELTRAVFSGLVDTRGHTAGPRATTLGAIAEAAGVSVDDPDLTRVLERFGAPSAAFIRADQDLLDGDRPNAHATRLELGSPALLTEWGELASWSRHELELARTYRALVQLAQDELGRRLGAQPTKPTELLQGARLTAAARWWESHQPSKAWAHRHSGTDRKRSDELFELAHSFILRSQEQAKKERDEAHRAEAAALARARRRTRNKNIAVAGVAAIVVASTALIVTARDARDTARDAAVAATARHAEAAAENDRLLDTEAELRSSLDARNENIVALNAQLELLEEERAELIDNGGNLQQNLDSLQLRYTQIVRAHDAALFETLETRKRLAEVERQLNEARAATVPADVLPARQ